MERLGGTPFGRSFRRLTVEQLEGRQLLAITVDTLIDEFDGSIVDGDVSLRDAINAARPGAIIDFSVSGTLQLDAVLGELTINKELTIAGPGASELTITAQGHSRVISIAADAVTEISGVSLTAGESNELGGAILNHGRLTLTDSVISGSSAHAGGGIASTNTLRVYYSSVSDNAAYDGGGIFDLGISAVVESSIAGNAAVNGGGMFNQSGGLQVVDSLVIGNSAQRGGGGIVNSGSLNLYDATIDGGFARLRGGGIFNRGGSAVVYQSTLFGNSTLGDGGAIFNETGQFSVWSSTLSENSALDSGGGIYNLDGMAIESSTLAGNSAGVIGGGFVNSVGGTLVQNSTLSGNSAAQGGGLANWMGGVTNVTYSTLTTNSASAGGGIATANTQTDRTLVSNSIVAGNLAANGSNVLGPLSDIAFSLIDADPLLGPLADNGGPTLTHALLPGSPAIDAGNPKLVTGVPYAPAYDQRGMPYRRVVDGDAIPGARIDIGAFELPVTCDFDDDLACSLNDIDALIGVIAAGTNDPAFDLTGDGLVDLRDRDAWLSQAGGMNLPSGDAYLLGDANLDGTVDGFDFIAWNQNKFKFTGSWSQGDFNADGRTNVQDFVLWNTFKFQSSDRESLRRQSQWWLSPQAYVPIASS